ncbi:MAG: DNA polymerase III subunit gamma/tau [Sedimentisphaerales bacterium]|nr:DNA polymerase III subunit gamma/tau [Sedimentisphaerales bacterium]
MSYTVLARRYRSETFDDVIGQEAVAQTLKNAIETGRVAHAYLFSGTRGIGKTTMARILAKALNCLKAEGPTTTPCCKCDLCVAVNEGDDIDVLEIDGASNTGVEHIRELRQNAIYRPARARFKVYIIDEVHMLSTSAFNALLKTLEEPPDYVKFILATTEPNKVLPTILSRCQRFDFRNILPDDITKHLKYILKKEGVKAEEALLRRIARLARGSMRDGLSLLDQILSMSEGKLTLKMLEDLLGTPRPERIVALVEAMGNNNLSEALIQVEKALNDGLALEQLAQALQEHFRDLMVLRNCGEKTELVETLDKAVRKTMMQQVELYDDATLVYNITVMEELHRAIKSSGSGRALLEAAVVRLTDPRRFTDTRQMLEELRHLQGDSEGDPTVSSHTLPQRVDNRVPSAKNSRSGQVPDKKKDITRDKTTGSGQFTPASTITGDYLKEHWQEIIEQLNQKDWIYLQTYLKLSRPVGWDGGVLTIGYSGKQNGMRSLLLDSPDKIEEIETALGQILHQRIKLELERTEDVQRASPDSNKNEESGYQKTSIVSPGAKPSQKEINAALNEPQVRRIQDVLGGKVRHIERMKDR